jgi:dipeptidyl aminopeptidase/acylaminoacyl peptidase
MRGYRWGLVGLVSLATALAVPAQVPLQTVPELTKHERTSTSAEVREFCGRLEKLSPLVRFSGFGTSHEGQSLPLLILSDPPVSAPSADSKKPVLLVVANIHAGEVDGKEAVLALARDLAVPKAHPILKDAVILIAPNFNPDGNDRISPKNRTEQNGPKGGVGTRANAQGLDLNRDFIKLETPEVRALMKLINTWDPLLIVDCHTTNGSYHRYTLTYDGPRYPTANAKLQEFANEKHLPQVAANVKKATRLDTFVYGDFDPTHTKWESYPSRPRYGVQLFGIRGHLGILSESYSYASFEDRIKASYHFVKSNLEMAIQNKSELQKLQVEARKPTETIALRSKTVAQPQKATVLGYVEETKNGKPQPTATKKEYECEIVNRVVSTLEVKMPAAYVLPPNATKIVETLQRHGIVVEELRETVDMNVQTYTVSKFELAPQAFQNHKLRTVEAGIGQVDVCRIMAGSFLVRANQPKTGNLAAYLLEPQSEDGLAVWNAFDGMTDEEQNFPALRLLQVPPVFTGPPRPLPEDRGAKQPITPALLGRGFGGPNLSGQSLGPVTWLPDGEHWLQRKGTGLWKVNARTGRSSKYLDSELIKKSLGDLLKNIPPMQVNAILSGAGATYSPDRTAVLFALPAGLTITYLDGTPGRILIKEKDREFVTFSPDGKHLAYVRGGNLYTVEIATAKAQQLTFDGGSKEILNGRADWVYEEEIFNRNGQAYWWSPDSQKIAFLRFDDSRVPKFHIVGSRGVRGNLESLNYPKPGDENPRVQLGVVEVGQSAVKSLFLNLGVLKPEDLLIARVGWIEGTKPAPYAYLQNRIQTWLDFVTWPDLKGPPKKLFRDSTKAWIEDPGEPHWLPDGSFLFQSERSGWKHLYHYSADGKLIRPITDGKWEIKSILRVDGESGDVYFTSGKVSATGSHLCTVNIKKPEVRVISDEKTTHSIQLAPKGALYIDTYSDDRTPAKSVLRELSVREIRVLNSNPAYERDRYRFGEYKREKITTQDGFVLEAAITYPPDFHPNNTYPVWVLTYAGPHAPTVRDGWGTGRLIENILATMGVVVMRVDPRSASGKGAESAWTCYKQLGVQELKDLEEAADWILKNSWADPKRIGISGHSFGGYISAYALTAGTKFTAGIAGAPVTDWRLYDSIYTERYMGLPSENQSGYDKTSAILAAPKLKGRLLIVHGLIDDNVHAQNSHQLISTLQKAGKEFEVMIYPDSRHGIADVHYPLTQINFIRRTFGLGSTPTK